MAHGFGGAEPANGCGPAAGDARRAEQLTQP